MVRAVVWTCGVAVAIAVGLPASLGCGDDDDDDDAHVDAQPVQHDAASSAADGASTPDAIQALDGAPAFDATAAFCGGFGGFPCDEGEYCRIPDGQCLVADPAGVCAVVPTACPDVYAPVCGCDGVTYGNRCEAQAASAQVDHEGEC